MEPAEKDQDGKAKKASGSETRKRAGLVGFRVTETERAELEAAAERVGLTLGSYIRSRVLEAPQTRAVRRPPVERVLLAQLLGQLGRVGGNIHQIVKRLNFGEVASDDELKSALSDFRYCTSEIMQAMGRKPHDN